jgi:hypothetical protein
MRPAWLLAAVLSWPVVSYGQASTVLHVTVMLQDTPVARHGLLISDNPSTSAPRRLFTKADGTLDVPLKPGSYTVESDRPFVHQGKAYQWTQMVNVVAGRGATLALTAQNAEMVPLSEVPPEPGAARGEPTADLSKWEESVVAIWSPTARATAFVVDAQGLIATTSVAVGAADTIEVQVSPAQKVPARVLAADVTRDVAVAWLDPGVVGSRPPVPMSCPPPPALSIDDRQELVAIAASLRTGVDQVTGDVTGLQPRAAEADLRIGYGGVGGPVFNQAGALVGLTSVPTTEEAKKRTDVTVVRVGVLCEVVAAARAKMKGDAPPSPASLPLEPARDYPADALEAAARSKTTATDPPVLSSTDFDVAFITPPMIARAEQRADWTGGRSTRSAEAEARIGRLTEFGAWSAYFGERPPVVIVRVTPKMVEGFWKRLGREAARTQGAELPAFKDFKTRFIRMKASCGNADLTPIHPMVLEHQVTDSVVIREGLYVFDPGALNPECGTVTLSLYSEKAPDKADTLVVDPKVIDRIWQDFAPWRAAPQ